jgi:hypothetical protein
MVEEEWRFMVMTRHTLLASNTVFESIQMNGGGYIGY